MPVKLTWKSIYAALAGLAGGLTASINALHLPPAVSTSLIVLAGLVLGAERLADSKDFATVTSALGLPATQATIEKAIAAAKADAAKAVADAEAKASQWYAAYKAVAAAVPSTSPTPVETPPAPAPAPTTESV